MIVSNLKLTYTVFGFFIMTLAKIFNEQSSTSMVDDGTES